MTDRFPTSKAPSSSKSSSRNNPGSIVSSKFAPDFSVTSSKEFFPTQVQVKLSDSESFHVYLHSSPENQIAGEATEEPQNKTAKGARPVIPGLCADPNSILVVLCLHGAGFSGLSWAPLAKHLDLSLLNTHLVAIDLRGHGRSEAWNVSAEHDLSFERLASDVCDVYNALSREKYVPSNMEGEDGRISNKVKLFVVGHSMGGALAAYIGANCRDRLANIAATCVIDVVEGSAMNALSGMKSVLQSRPKSFSSSQQAVEWAVRSGYIKRRESAKISMIGQITKSTRRVEQKSTATFGSLQEVENDDDVDQNYIEPPSETNHNIPITTEDKQPNQNEAALTPEHLKTDDGFYPKCVLIDVDKQESSRDDNCSYSWRIDLFKTEKFWTSWFVGLTENYLSFPGPKLLILAGVDRLDKELTVAQMQGKFQMLVLPKAGHAVHEDVPDLVADALATFVQRNKLAPTVESGFSRTNAGC